MLAVVGGCATYAEPPAGGDWRAAAATLARAEISSGGPPSIQIAVGYEGELIFNEAFGTADVENDVRATPDTMYRTASISKWMTAAAAMVLIEKGRLDLDRPIQEYCPAYPEKRWEVTTRHLLTHTAGLRHYTDYADELAAASNETQRLRVELRRMRDQNSRYQRYTDVLAPLDTFKADALRFKPGTDYLYTSYGYRLLACVLQGADRSRDFRTILREAVFIPAGTPAIVEDDSWAIIPRRAGMYSLQSEKGLRRADLRDVSENLPAGGHLAKASDLVRFAMAFYDGKIVSRDSIMLMETPLAGPKGEPVEPGHGHGLMILPIGSKSYIGHTGGQAGTASVLFYEPKTKITIAVMSNADTWAGLRAFAERLFPAILSGVYRSD
ncbi:serine hydrolase domain-containing protein [Sphingosinicella rhizophila]|uniref:Serine hydrolase domain-containing protein n=1 Tax=Sphingosinicella rhizophila TaxID=3050082 RepID=A0ABU3Q3M1_9SPHN|nr:serine hydrolase domain-containing protein [Sphingosinicella sp. GR2756]MDT9597912.1 serine hydrolase domain-containing protein [Sphingosinicella sp. GR2756]